MSTLVAGCASVGPPQHAPEPAPVVRYSTEATDELRDVLSYFNTLRRLSATELAREHDAARQAFAASGSEPNRLRLALVLSYPGASFKDERRALELLDPMVRDLRTAYTPLRGFASVVHALLREQNRIGSNAQALKEKLDALKSLEKSLAERERAAPGVGR
jgi:hypothetical protein